MNDAVGDTQALVDYRMKRARETLKDAHLLFSQGGSHGSVINRAYYSMFYAVLALLTTIGKGAGKHSGVISLFDQHFVKTRQFPREMSKSLHRAFDLRQIGDYRELMPLDRERAEETLQSAEQFISGVEQYLNKGRNDNSRY